MFVRLIWVVGLRDARVILVQAPRGALVQFGRVFYMPTGACSRGTSLVREREHVQVSECGGELEVLCWGLSTRSFCMLGVWCAIVCVLVIL
jgi:hypothetical protein